MLAEARPELLERRPGWGASVRSSTTIHLEPLSSEDMRLLLGGLVSGLPEHAMRAIVERAEGVPLYAVETLRMLIDRGVLQPSEDGDRFTLAVDLPELDVPATLQALIAARLDTLAAEDRSLLMDASVLGLSFTVPSLRALTEMDDAAVAASLDRLVRHQLVVLDADPRSPERGQFRFVQGVVREVAYQALAKRDRRAKHMAAARHLESLGDDELAGVLANHYLAAFHATPAGPEADTLAAQARVALRAAAERAAALHSLVGALGYVEQAITVTTDPRELALAHERAGASRDRRRRRSSAAASTSRRHSGSTRRSATGSASCAAARSRRGPPSPSTVTGSRSRSFGAPSPTSPTCHRRPRSRWRGRSSRGRSCSWPTPRRSRGPTRSSQIRGSSAPTSSSRRSSRRPHPS